MRKEILLADLSDGFTGLVDEIVEYIAIDLRKSVSHMIINFLEKTYGNYKDVGVLHKPPYLIEIDVDKKEERFVFMCLDVDGGKITRASYTYKDCGVSEELAKAKELFAKFTEDSDKLSVFVRGLSDEDKSRLKELMFAYALVIGDEDTELVDRKILDIYDFIKRKE